MRSSPPDQYSSSTGTRTLGLSWRAHCSAPASRRVRRRRARRCASSCWPSVPRSSCSRCAFRERPGMRSVGSFETSSGRHCRSSSSQARKRTSSIGWPDSSLERTNTSRSRFSPTRYWRGCVGWSPARRRRRDRSSRSGNRRSSRSSSPVTRVPTSPVLAISRKTAAKHIEHILRKLDVHSEAQAVALAAREHVA
jgi:hypothetical protein